MPDYSAYHPPLTLTTYPSLINAFMDKVGDDFEYMTWDVRIDEDYKLIFGPSYAAGFAIYWDTTGSNILKFDSKGTNVFTLNLADTGELYTYFEGPGGTHILTIAEDSSINWIAVGENNTRQGYCYLYGGTIDRGGSVYLFTGNNHDTSIDYYEIAAYEDDLQIGPTGGPYFKYEGGLGHFTLGDNLEFLAGVLLASNGAVGAPSLGFSGDTDTGLYLVGAADIGVAVAGSKVADFIATGVRVADGLGLISGNDSDISMLFNGTHGYVDNKTGTLYIREAKDSDFIRFQTGATPATRLSVGDSAVYLGTSLDLVNQAIKMNGASGPYIEFGSGAPGATRPRGSLYIRTDTAGLYQNTDGSTTWVAF